MSLHRSRVGHFDSPQQEEHRWKLIQVKMSHRHRRVSSKSAATTHEHVVDGHKRKTVSAPREEDVIKIIP